MRPSVLTLPLATLITFAALSRAREVHAQSCTAPTSSCCTNGNGGCSFVQNNYNGNLATAITGLSTNGAGISGGDSASGQGVLGTSATGVGVFGQSGLVVIQPPYAQYGVYGQQTQDPGSMASPRPVTGFRASPVPLPGFTAKRRTPRQRCCRSQQHRRDGVYGSATGGYGLSGEDTSTGFGVYGQTVSGTGIYGISGSGEGFTVSQPLAVAGLSAKPETPPGAELPESNTSTGHGVYGKAAGGYGIDTAEGYGVYGTSTAGRGGVGVWGEAAASVGVFGTIPIVGPASRAPAAAESGFRATPTAPAQRR